MGYAVGAWIAAQVAGFFVEQGYVGRTLLDVVLYLLIVGFFAMLVVMWYHGEGGHQKVQRIEAILMTALLAIAVGGSAIVATRDGGPDLASGDEAVVDLGDRSVAVLPFENDLDDPSMAWLDRGVSELLATDLSQVESLRVVGGQRIIDLMAQIGEAESRVVPEEQRTRVTQMAGARYMLSGRLAGSPDNVVLIATLTDSDTGVIAASAREQGPDVFALVDAVSAELLSEALAPGEAGLASIADITTGDLEAYAAYQAGLEARYLFLFPEAREHFSRAVEIDSTFALAHFQLAGVQVQTGDFVGSTESLRLASEYLTHASPRDRAYIEGLGAMIRGDLEEGERRLREMIDRFPDEKDGRIMLASMLRNRDGSGPEVARLLEETLRLDPSYSAGYNELAYAEAGRGNLDSALALLDIYANLEPDQPNPWDSRGELLVRAGRVEEGREAFRRALDVNPTFTVALRHLVESQMRDGLGAEARADLGSFRGAGDSRTRMVAHALEAETWFWDGDLDAGLAALRAGIDVPGPDPGEQVNLLRSLLFAHVQTGRHDAIPGLADRMAELSRIEGSHFIALIVRAGEEGRIDEMSRHSDEMVRTFQSVPGLQDLMPVAISFSQIWNAFYRGEHERVIELARNAPFRQGATGTDQLGYPVMRSLLATGRDAEAVGHVDVVRRAGITGVPGQWDALTFRLLQYWEGRAHEMAGNTEAAVSSYETLLEAWGETVRDVPYTADLEDRLESLRR